MPEPKYRRPLNSKQINLLKVIYKFRFVSVELLDRSNTKNGRDVKSKGLTRILEQDYIARNYESSYRLQNKPAIYYLAPKGIRYLQNNTDLDNKTLHAAYNDKNANELFISHSLNIFRLYRKFNQLYPGRYDFFTKSELADFDEFPKLRPDAYLQDMTGNGDFFLDSLEQYSPAFVIKKRLRSYIEHSESDEWDELERELPSLLLVCATPAIENSIQKYTARLINATGADIDIFTTSHRALLEAKTAQDEIWTDITEPEELVSLNG